MNLFQMTLSDPGSSLANGNSHSKVETEAVLNTPSVKLKVCILINIFLSTKYPTHCHSVIYFPSHLPAVKMLGAGFLLLGTILIHTI